MQPQNVPPATPTPNVGDAELQKLMDAANPPDPNAIPQTPTPEPPKPITVNIMGQQVQFKDEAELSAQLTAYLQQQAQQPQAPQGYVTGKEDEPQEPKWTEADMKEYVRLMGTNPMEAADYLDKKRGIPRDTLQQTIEENQRLNRTLAAIQFRDTHPTLPFSPQLANALEQRRQQLGLPFTYEGLDASYWSLVGSGVLPPPQFPPQPQAPQFPQQSQMQQQPPANPYFNAPPPVPRGGTPQEVNPDLMARFENMSADQLARVLAEYEARTKQGR